MTIVIFTGPTLTIEDVHQVLPEAICLPPVAQGDVYRALQLEPHTIGIIDGYFDHRPAVWHKEILWAMKHGVHVIGSASMGALRAAELNTFGMVGIGKIYEMYRTEQLEDDDEVAVAHASAQDNYRALSTAMVDIRATLERASQQNIITPEEHEQGIITAKNLYYPRRDYPALLKHITNPETFKSWLQEHRVHQKRDDARAMLQHIQQQEATPKPVQYTVHTTTMWHTMTQQAGGFHIDEQGITSVLLEDILEELRLQPARYQKIRQSLPAKQIAPRAIPLYIADALQEQNLHAEFVERAANKKRLLAAYNLITPTRDDLGIDNDTLLNWYFQNIPTDLNAYAKEYGFEDDHDFMQALICEYAYQHYSDGNSSHH